MVSIFFFPGYCAWFSLFITYLLLMYSFNGPLANKFFILLIAFLVTEDFTFRTYITFFGVSNCRQPTNRNVRRKHHKLITIKYMGRDRCEATSSFHSFQQEGSRFWTTWDSIFLSLKYRYSTYFVVLFGRLNSRI